MSRVALVLGGGGAVGHGFHGGLLAALEETAGFDARSAEIIVGTSSGATVAGLVRAGLTGTDLAGRAHGEISPRLADVDARRAAPAAAETRFPVRLGGVAPASPGGALEALRRHGTAGIGPVLGALLPPGPVPTIAAGGPLDRLFPDGWPTDALWISAVGIDDGERVIFGREGDPVTDVPTAVAASCALPGWFTPVVVANRRYIDGAVWSATNADVLADAALDLVIISAPLSGTTTPLHLWQRRRLRAEVRALRARGVPVVVVEPTAGEAAAMGVNIMDKRRRRSATQYVRESMTRRLTRGDLTGPRALLSGY